MKISNVPVGALIVSQDGKFRYHVASQDQPEYEGTTLLSSQIVLIGPLDAAEPDNPDNFTMHDRAQYGNNDFASSNLLQWLNSDTTDWYVPAHKYDKGPESTYIRHHSNAYIHKAGYMSQIPKSIRDHLLISRIPYHCSDKNGNPDITYAEAKIFIPSRTELGLGDDYNLPEGSPLPLLRDIRFKAAYLTPEVIEAYDSPWKPEFPMMPGFTWRYWMRSPHLKYTYLTRYAAQMGGLSFCPAYYDIVGCRPMMNIAKDLNVELVRDKINCYVIKED